MPPAPLPDHEAERLAALRSYDVLDTACEAVFDEIARLAARLTGCPIALVSLVDADRQWFKARHGLDTTETPRDVAFCAYAILNPERPLLVPDAAKDRRFAGNPLVTGPIGLRAYAGVPLVNPEGFALGALCVMDRRPRRLTADQVEILVGLARSAATALELHRAMRRARDLALTDGLTGLPNRSALLHALDRTLARQRQDGQGLALLYLDLDGFKAVNDGGGHAAGDAVLREVAAALRACTRPLDMAARIGGDEFAVLLGSADGAPAVAERIRARIAVAMANRHCPVTASVGAVTFPAAPASVDAALAAVDAAMYESKAAGRNRVCHRVQDRAVEAVAA
jgi:diguanylate cyclase (GGDEF)-like protein